jgi:hypothetical protein
LSLQQLSRYFASLDPFQVYASVVVLAFIVALLLYFFCCFVVPAALTYWSLRKARKRVDLALRQSDFDASAPQTLGEVFANSRSRSSWQAYEKTLVSTKHLDDAGFEQVVGWYTGTPAGVYFTESALIEVPLRTEFFKHLPGILTGLGIIGTFVGIITGLNGVNLGADQKETLTFLNRLMHTVGSAFIVSALAISFATLVTIVEKMQLAAALGELARLENLLDRFFNKDLTDESLNRLVTASEVSATQMAHLKDALVTDLKELLDQLAVKNNESLKAQTNELSRSLADSIKASFDEPIGRITEAVNSMSASQSDNVNRLLTDMMTGFAARFETVMVKQNSEMSRMLDENTSLIRGIAADFMSLAGSLKDAGKDAVSAMADEIQGVLRSLADQQQAAGDAMAEFARKLQSTLAESQEGVHVRQERLIEQLSTAVAESLSRAQTQGQALADEQRLQQSTFNDTVERATGVLSAALDSLIERNTAAIVSLENNVSSLTNVTVSAIDGIERGARKLQDATLGLAEAGENLATSLQLAGTSSSEIERAAAQLSRATDILQSSISTNEAVASLFSQVVIDLRQTVEAAKREASVTSGLVMTIERAAEKIKESGQLTEEYLQKVSTVLADTHREFAGSVEQTLKTMSQRFHQDLSDAVSLLSGSVNDLRVYLDELNESLSRNAG